MIALSEAKQIARMLSAVGEPTRMFILHELAVSPLNVGQLAKSLGIAMVNMSHHLGVLRQAGILESTRNGRRIIYSLHPEVFTPSTTPDALGTLRFGAMSLVILQIAKNAPASHSDGKLKRGVESSPKSGPVNPPVPIKRKSPKS